MAAFTAKQPGEILIEPHTEAEGGRGQQEVYVVIRGKARFLIDGSEVETPAGTLLRIDPKAHRGATALEVDTAVLALGGESTFEPSASEWIERARPHLRLDPSQASDIIDDLRRALPGDRGIDVGEALLAVAEGNESKARSIVAQLVAELPELRSVLARDPDLRGLLPT